MVSTGRVVTWTCKSGINCMYIMRTYNAFGCFNLLWAREKLTRRRNVGVYHIIKVMIITILEQ